MNDQRKLELLARYTEAVARHPASGDVVAYRDFEQATFELLVALLGRAPTDREIEKLLFIGTDD